MAKIAVGIVLFNPDLKRFKRCIDKILHQVEKVYIFDNSSVELNIDFDSNIVYKSLKYNHGISYALNEIMRMAKEDGFDWVVTMDQDSIIPDGIINEYLNNIKEKENEIGIICPQVIDKRRSYMKVKTSPEKEYINECITSASCTSIKAWEAVGGFDEWLFIDLVDNEFCKRLVVSGFKILRLNNWVLDQEFGKIVPKSEKKQKFWILISKILRNENFAKFSYRKFVSPMRVFYTNRNIIYVNRKMKLYGKTGYENYNCKSYIGFLMSFSLPSLLRAQEKRKVLIAICKGIYFGLKKDVDPWKASNAI